MIIFSCFSDQAIMNDNIIPNDSITWVTHPVVLILYSVALCVTNNYTKKQR